MVPGRWLLIVLLSFAAPASSVAAYLGADGAAADAVQEILEKAGASKQVLGIEITGAKVTVLTRNNRGNRTVDRWTHGEKGAFLSLISAVSGPVQVAESKLVRNLAEGLFDPSEVGLDRFDEIMRAAVQYAVMEPSASVKKVTIRRRISIVPQPAYGDVRWTIQIESPRESASVSADESGRIIGADLSDTVRGQSLDLRRDDWPLAIAAKRLAPHLGDGADVWQVYFYRSSVQVQANHPTKRSLQRTYTWTLDRVTRGFADSPSKWRILEKTVHGQSPDLGPQPPWVLRSQSLPFAFNEVDFKALPSLKTEAKTLLDLPGGAITRIRAEKKRGRQGVQWEITVADKGDRRIATVTFDGTGKPVEVHPDRDSVDDADAEVRNWAKSIAMEPAGKTYDKKAYERAKDLHFRVMTGAGADVVHALALTFADRNTILHDYKVAAHWFRRAAEQGHAEAMFFLGILHSAGQGVEKDPGAAATWYEKSAAAGSADAMYNLGYLHLDGKGVAQDDEAALRWFRKASEKGHSRSMYTVGAMHFEGRGVARDNAKALEWFTRSADSGNAEALPNMAFMLARGLGTERDDRKAAGLMLRGLEAGSKAAVKELTENSDAWNERFRIEIESELKRRQLIKGDVDGGFGAEVKAAVRALADGE